MREASNTAWSQDDERALNNDLPPRKTFRDFTTLSLAHMNYCAIDSPASVLGERIRALYSEIDCRIEHGADSGGHLEYVRDKLNGF